MGGWSSGGKGGGGGAPRWQDGAGSQQSEKTPPHPAHPLPFSAAQVSRRGAEYFAGS